MCGSSTLHHKILGKRMNRHQGMFPSKKTAITTSICKCDACGLIYSNPQPIPYDIQDHYGIPPESYWTPEYFVVSDGYFAGEINRFKSLANFKPGMKVLDIGAGLGKGIIAMNKAGFDAYGFEPSEPFYKRAIEQMGMNPEKFKLGMLEDMEYTENYFDFVSFGAVLEHLYDPGASIIKAMRWLKPGGYMHIEVPSSDWLVNKLINFIYRITGTDYVANLSPMHEPFHLHEFGLQSFKKHAASYNYEVAFHEYYVCLTYLPRIINVFIIPYMKMTDTGMQLSIWLRKKV